MTQLDRAKTMNEALLKLKGLQQEQHRLEKYITREGQLRTGAELLAGLSAITKELRTRGIEPTGFMETCRGHQREVRRVTVEFSTNPASIDDQPADTFWQPLNHIPGKVQKGVLKAWKDYVEQSIPPIKADILAVLTKVPGMKEQAANVRQLLTQMEGLGANLPNQGDFEKVNTLGSQITKAWNELDGLPQAVLDFLREAHTPSGARLPVMTKEVFDWLNQTNLLTNYVVKAR